MALNKQAALLADATHVICQANSANFTADEINALDKANVHAVSVNYLQSYIQSEKPPDVKAYLFNLTRP